MTVVLVFRGCSLLPFAAAKINETEKKNVGKQKKPRVDFSIVGVFVVYFRILGPTFKYNVIRQIGVLRFCLKSVHSLRFLSLFVDSFFLRNSFIDLFERVFFFVFYIESSS